MSVEHKAFKGASWLALFKLMSQVFSWLITIFVARLLAPSDYGLYAMAFIVTGYAAKFNELGLGAAIIQRQKLNDNELSSVFWFSLSVGALFALACFPISYLTAYLFHDDSVIPLTQTAAIIFILSSLVIVPLNILRKELNFKGVGLIEFSSTIISGVIMLLIAYLGGGVWALISSRITIAAVTFLLLLVIVKWRPKFHFSYRETRSYIKFGLFIAVGGSLYYIFENSDKYFAGRIMGPALLGYYTFALTLANLPTEKIVVLINQVSFPAFSKLLSDKENFNKFYLNIIKITATIVIPIFVGGFMIGGDMVKVLLGDKWLPITNIFEWLCLSQIITALNACNNFVHDARGNPNLSFRINLILAISMPIAFYIAAHYGLNGMIIPWLSVYFLVCVYWVYFTIKELNISVWEYLSKLSTPVAASVIMSLAIYAFEYLRIYFPMGYRGLLIVMLCKILIGLAVYLTYLWVFDRNVFYSIKKLKTKKYSEEVAG